MKVGFSGEEKTPEKFPIDVHYSYHFRVGRPKYQRGYS